MRRLLLLLPLLVALAGCGGATKTVTTTTPTNPPTTTPTNTGEGPTPTTTSKCGKERWDVKTLMDSAASQVSTGRPRDTTIAQLAQDASKAVPAQEPTDRVAPLETTVYRVHATLTLAKREADSDYHLVITQGADQMIAEIPSPTCATRSVVLTQLKQVRQVFDTAIGKISQVGQSVHPNRPVTVTGVGFFDRDHGQTGRLPVGAGEDVELHPVLELTVG